MDASAIDDLKKKNAIKEIHQSIGMSVPEQSDVTEDYWRQKLAEDNKTIKAFQSKPDVPNIKLGEVLSGEAFASPTRAAKLAKLNEPIDKSTGIDIPENDISYQKIATARTLGINGPKDYKQFTYDMGDQRGQASPGTNIGDTFVADTMTGGAGLNIASSDTLRPMDMSEGNPAFFKSRYPLLETTVAPFKVKIPAYNIEVDSKTMDPDKLAFQVATMIGGSQLPMYMGYTNLGFDLTEPWYSTFSKGVSNVAVEIPELIRSGLSGVIGGMSWAEEEYGLRYLRPQVGLRAFAKWVAKDIFGYDAVDDLEEGRGPFEYVEDVLSSDVMKRVKDDWQELVQLYEQQNGTTFTEFTTETSRLIGQVPNTAAQMALAWLVSAYTGPAAPFVLGAFYGGVAYEDALEGLKDVPISYERKRDRAFWGGLGSAALNTIGFETVYGGLLVATRKWIMNYGGRLLAAGATGVVSAGVEGLTEYADEKLQDLVTMNMGDNQAMNRLENYKAAGILGVIMGLAGIPANIRAEKIQIAKEIISGENLKAGTQDKIVRDIVTAVKYITDMGIYTKEQGLQIIAEGAESGGQAFLRDDVRKTMLGALARITPEAVAHAKKMGAKQSEAFIKELNELGQKTYESLPEQIDVKTRTMVSRAMQGIGALITYYGGNFKAPKFEIVNEGPFTYDDKTNTIYINPNSTGEAADIRMVQNRELRTLDPVQRGILHELGHMIDAQLGRGTNFKDFLPAYFDAISRVYGKDKAQRVQGLMNKSGDRLEFAKSESKAVKAEKAMDKLTGNINEKNTSEYWAYALGRLGKNVGKALGFDNSEVGQYIDAANILAQSLKIPSIQEALDNYKKAITEVVRENSEALKGMAKRMGEDGLARAIQDFIAGDTTALTKEDVAALYRVLKSYTGLDVQGIIDKAFAGVKPETFMQRAEREFAESIKEGRTVGDIQDAIAKKEGVVSEQTTDDSIHEDTINIDDIIKEQSKENVSALEKRAAEKPDGKTYQEDAKEVMSIMKKHHGKTPKWFSKMFGHGDLVMSLWSLGGKELVDHFDLIGKMNRSSTKAFAMMEQFNEGLKKEMGWKSDRERDEFNNNASIDSIEVTTVDPLLEASETKKISPLVAMNLYLTSLSKDGYSKVLNTFSRDELAFKRMVDSLTPEQRKYADYMMNFIAEHWKYYKDSFKQEGEDVGDEPYWPFADATHIAMGDRRINSNVGRKADPEGMISTEVDVREVFNSYVQRAVGGEEHVYATLRRMKDLFGYEKGSDVNDYPTDGYRKLEDQMWENTKRFRSQGIANFGKERRYQQFVDLINDFLRKREASLVGSEALNIAARNLTSGLLMFKPIQFVKNLTNVSMFWGLVDNQAQYWKDTAWAVAHPIQAKNYMLEKVPLIRERLRGRNIDEALTQQTAGSDSLLMEFAKKSNKLNPQEKEIISKVVSLTQAARRLGFAPMLSGDATANIIGGYGVLKQYEAKYGDRAGDKLSEDIVMRQASNNQATRSLLQREWNRDIRGEFIRFASEPKQKAKSIAMDIAQAQAGEQSWGQAAKRILSTLSGMIMFALVSAGVWDLFDDDEENDEAVYEAMTREGLSAAFGASVVGNSILAPILTSPFTGSKGSLGTPLSTILSTDLYKLSKGEWRDLALDGIGATAMPGIKSLANRGRGGYEAITAETPQELRSGLLQVGGREKRYADERAGIKKEKVEKKSKK